MAIGFRSDCEGVHRRDFLRIGSAGLLGMGLADLLRFEARAAEKGAAKNTKATSVIMVWLAGGPATIDMWDLRPDAPDNIRGEFKPIKTSAEGIEISEHLPKMAKVTDRCTIIRSIHHTIAAHLPGTIYMTTGNRPTPALQYPSLGSLAAKALPVEPGVPSYVTFGPLRNGQAGGPGYLGTAYSPFEIEGGGRGGELRVRGISLPRNFSLAELEDRNKLLETFDEHFKAVDQSADVVSGMEKFHQQALDILRSDKTKKAFDMSNEQQATRDKYGRTPFGQSALAARRLIEAGVRFVTIGTGGWDTHNNNFQSLKTRNLPQLDEGLAALIEDLDQRGLLENTIVYCAGEFNRTPRINQRGGRDHWARSMAVVVAGGGLPRGHVLGSTDKEGMAPATEPCSPDDVAATIFHQLGIDPAHELMTNTGRPVQLFREGKVLTKLVG